MGVVLTVIADVVTVVVPQLLVADSVYTPAAAVPTVNAAGDSKVEEKLLGPLHEYDVAPVAAPVSVSVAPEQSVVADGVADTGVGAPEHPPVIVAVVVAWAVHVAESVTVMVYVPL